MVLSTDNPAINGGAMTAIAAKSRKRDCCQIRRLSDTSPAYLTSPVDQYWLTNVFGINDFKFRPPAANSPVHRACPRQRY
ncbi:hypothetical protein Mal52_50260 [Symmachiella dynata]|uniref:Uncharacterized protein n=1 Tax=Symmachiella dynata TaxID=2527995 RepID=A0A517ZVN0_9PLAN|nr:hypothetical protein Mal52_50260 [Symmachiella dynata]